ncbi:hypothetical protein D3C79_572050 [compost metagenome]
MPRRAGAKGIASKHGHAVLLQQSFGKGLGAEARRTNINHHEHTSVRLVYVNARTTGEAGTDSVTPFAVGVTHLRYLWQLLFQRQLRSVEDEVRQPVEHTQRQVAQMLAQGRRSDDPAHAPARHCMGLGQAVDGNAALRHAWQACGAYVLALVQQLAIDLVADQPQVMFNADLRQTLPSVPGHTDPGRIVWAVEQQCPGSRRNPRGDVGRVEAKALFGANRYRYHLRRTRAEHRLVGDIHRLDNDNLVPRIEQALGDSVQGALRSRQYHYLVRTNPLGTMAHLLAGNGLTQAEAATHVGVMGMACAQAVHGGLDNGRWRIEVRIANRQQENLAPLFLQFQRMVVNVPGGSTVTGDTLGER